MTKLSPKIIAQITNGEYIGAENDKEITVSGAVRDNREVEPGNLFVCIKGARVNGHDFANNAFDAGAACCLAEEKLSNAKGPYILVKSTLEAIKTIGEYYRSLFKIPVIGITGSVGKTTAKEIIASVLSEKFNVLKTEMNLNNELGVPLTLLRLNENHEAAVIEMGISDFGEMSRLAKMARPDIFVMTKIGYAHIEELGDLQGVLKAKTEAFAFMKPEGIAVLNGDDELLNSYDPKMRKITFGLDEHNDVRAMNIQIEGFNKINLDILVKKETVTEETIDKGTVPEETIERAAKERTISEECSERTNEKAETFPITISAYGNHLASLAPAAVTIAKLLGMTNDEIQKGFMLYSPVDGRSRINKIEDNGIILIDDCYNANPNSVKAALTSIASLPGRHIAVLGDMLNLGKHSDQMHKEIGEFAAENGIDILICHGKQSKFIYEGFIKANEKDVRASTPSTHDKATKTEKTSKIQKAYYYSQMDELISKLPELIKKDDVILVKASRGMQFEKLLPVISQLKPEKKII